MSDEKKHISELSIDWKYFFGCSCNRTYERYYEAKINGIRVEKHSSHRGEKYSIGNIDKAKVKYKTEAELLAALSASTSNA